MSETLILKVDGEDIRIDESFMDFSDFTPKEYELVSRTLGKRLLKSNEEPTAGGVAVMLTIKLCRGREWSAETTSEVIELLTAWLTDELVEVDA